MDELRHQCPQLDLMSAVTIQTMVEKRHVLAAARMEEYLRLAAVLDSARLEMVQATQASDQKAIDLARAKMVDEFSKLIVQAREDLLGSIVAEDVE